MSQLQRILRINHPFHGPKYDSRPLRDFLPGAWPAWGEFVEEMNYYEQVDKALKTLIDIAEHCAPVPGHEGSCGPESMCDGQCVDAANCSQAIFAAKRLLKRYA